MAKGRAGADSSVPVTTEIQGKNIIDRASEVLQGTPVLWGRYFTSVSSSGDVEYRHLKENQILHRNNIRLLPIARQTKRVNGSREDGSADAKLNVEDLIATFGQEYLAAQGGQFLMFLDVEGAPSLSPAYYLGWAQTLASRSAEITGNSVKILPGAYATQGDTKTWQAIIDAGNAGAQCEGAWVARWVHRGCHELIDWNDATVAPKVKIPCRVLLWQYSDDCFGGGGFDCNETNPAIDLQTDLLSRLVLPPDTSA